MTLTLRAHIEKGRIVVDEPVELPDGTPVQVAVLDDGDQLDAEDRARLAAALDEAQDQLDRGDGIPAETYIAKMRARRSQ